MRAVPSALALLIATASAAGAAGRTTPSAKPAPVLPYAPELHRPIRIHGAATVPHGDLDLPLRLGSGTNWDQRASAASADGAGPFQSQIGGTAKRTSIARYRLEGIDVLGGSVEGSVDGRAARITVRWPPGDDD